MVTVGVFCAVFQINGDFGQIKTGIKVPSLIRILLPSLLRFSFSLSCKKLANQLNWRTTSRVDVVRGTVSAALARCCFCLLPLTPRRKCEGRALTPVTRIGGSYWCFCLGPSLIAGVLPPSDGAWLTSYKHAPSHVLPCRISSFYVKRYECTYRDSAEEWPLFKIRRGHPYRWRGSVASLWLPINNP